MLFQSTGNVVVLPSWKVLLKPRTELSPPRISSRKYRKLTCNNTSVGLNPCDGGRLWQTSGGKNPVPSKPTFTFRTPPNEPIVSIVRSCVCVQRLKCQGQLSTRCKALLDIAETSSSTRESCNSTRVGCADVSGLDHWNHSDGSLLSSTESGQHQANSLPLRRERRRIRRIQQIEIDAVVSSGQFHAHVCDEATNKRRASAFPHGSRFVSSLVPPFGVHGVSRSPSAHRSLRPSLLDPMDAVGTALSRLVARQSAKNVRFLSSAIAPLSHEKLRRETNLSHETRFPSG